MSLRDAAVLDVRPLLPGERDALVTLLGELSTEDWETPTACGGWSVADVARHLLDDDLGWLSRGRDGDLSGQLDESGDYRSFVRSLDEKNQRWVDGTRGLSPRVVTDLLRWSGEEFQRHVDGLDLDEPSSVIWSGPDPAPRWFDLARDFTERWVHHQQIRDAVGRPGLTDDEHLGAVLRTFLWALPHHYRDVAAPAGTTLVIWITGPGGGAWSLVCSGAGPWDLDEGEPDRRDAEVALTSDAAWRLLTGAEIADEAVELRGRLDLARPFLTARSIIV